MLHLDFAGLRLTVESDHPSVLDHVRRDYAPFLTSAGEPGLTLRAHLGPPPYHELPDVPASFTTPRNVVYRDGSRRFVDYFGRGLLRQDAQGCLAYSEDLDLLREILYLFVLSTCGQHYDRLGRHRLHALALEVRGRAVLLLLPSGGGKSTMAVQMLRQGYTMLSEDSPLIDRRGDVHPFPLCLGLKQTGSAEIPRQFQRSVRRMEAGPKTLVDLDYFGPLPGFEPRPPWILMVGRRRSGTTPAIRALSRGGALRSLVENLVVGIGIYQGLEFLLQRSSLELLGKLRLAASRSRAALALARRSQSYQFDLGRDVPANAAHLERFLATLA